MATPSVPMPLFTALAPAFGYGLTVFQFLLLALCTFATLVIFSLVLTLLPSKNKPPPPFERSVLSTLARLCSVTYGRPRYTGHGNRRVIVVEPLPARVEKRDDGRLRVTARCDIEPRKSHFKIVDTYRNSSVWLFDTKGKSSVVDARWVVAFRGTSVLKDLLTDAELAASVATDRDIGIEKAFDKIAALLTKVFSEHKVSRSDSIQLIGHSLGASVAEAMLLRLKKDGYSSVLACGFDSPGLPQWYRDGYEAQDVYRSRPLTLVYMVDNFINNLTPAPPGASCFRVNKVEPLDYLNVLNFIKTALKNGVSLIDMIKGSIDEHRNLEKMADLIDDGYFEHDEETSGRDVSGQVLRFIYRAYCSIVYRGASKGDPAPKDAHSIRTADAATESKAKTAGSEFSEFPDVETALQAFYDKRGGQPTPYAVTNFHAFANKLDAQRDIVCPFIGVTSVGKTSLLKAIFNLAPDDNLLRVSAVMDTTTTDTVLLWKVLDDEEDKGNTVRLWLMDMPGVHGSAAGHKASSAKDMRLRSQLYAMKEMVQAAVYVTGTNPNDEAKRLFREVCEVLGDRVLVVHNVLHTVRQNQERNRLRKESQNEYRAILQEVMGKSVGALHVVLAKVARCNGATENDLQDEMGVSELRSLLSEWLRRRRLDIWNAVQREKYTTVGWYWMHVTEWAWWSNYRRQTGRESGELECQGSSVAPAAKIGLGSVAVGVGWAVAGAPATVAIGTCGVVCVMMMAYPEIERAISLRKSSGLHVATPESSGKTTQGPARSE